MLWLVVGVAVVALINLCMLGLMLFAVTRARRAARDLRDQVLSFFSPRGEQPSEFADLTDKMAAIFSARLVTSLQAAVRGSAGGAATALAKSEQGELFAANPLAGLLGGKLGKSPLAVAALSLLGQQLTGGGGNNHKVKTTNDGMSIH